ncbi:MAG: hypothetical protein HUU46_22640 [Candidatus Hydrogenedentes bacterium]|nr:hypothetical protein [Candidatus Hydrogenedentota bacterium]
MKLSSRVGAFEIAGNEVRLAVVQTGGAQPTLLEWHVAALAYDTVEELAEAFMAAVQKILAEVKARPALFVLCINSANMVVRTLTVPFRGHARVTAAVPVELEPTLAFPIDDLIIDHTVIKEAPGETTVLVVAIKQSILEDQISEFAAAGVNIEGINLDVAGLSTLWLAGRRKPAGLHAQLHIRDDGAIFAAIHGRKLVYFRHLAATAERAISDPRALSRDARNTLRAFATSWSGEEAVEDLTVTGIEFDSVSREEFEDGLNVPVVYANLAKNVRGAEKAVARLVGVAVGDGTGLEPPNRWEAAAGAAAAAAGSGVFFELRKGPLAPANVFAGMRPRLLGSAAMLFVTLAGIAGYCAAQYQNNIAETERIGAEIWSIYAATFPDAEDAKERPEGDVGGQLSMELLEARQKEAEESASRLSAEMLARPPLLAIIKELADTFPSGKVVLSQIQVRDARGGSQSLVVEGEIVDTAGFNEAVDKLKQSATFKLDDDPTLATKEGKTFFRMQATI